MEDTDAVETMVYFMMRYLEFLEKLEVFRDSKTTMINRRFYLWNVHTILQKIIELLV